MTEGNKLGSTHSEFMLEVVPYNDDVTMVKTATSQEGGHPIMWIISYLVRDTLFDAGCANALRELEKFAAETEINSVYITHAHEDHYGGCSAFEPRSTIFATEADSKLLRDPPNYGEFFAFVWGQPKAVTRVEMMPPQFSVGDLEFEVIPLPGHWQDMVGFHEPNKKWLFTADAVPLPSRKKIGMPEENIPTMISTMEMIADMDIEIMFDSHKGPVTSHREHIKTRVDFIRNIKVKAQDLHNEGKTIPEIQEALELTGPWYLEMTKDRFGIDIFIKSLLFDKTEK
ncbi:MAG: MBL fold metallo-hydrolase [Candidatus Thorarchaeota archaeon]